MAGILLKQYYQGKIDTGKAQGIDPRYIADWQKRLDKADPRAMVSPDTHRIYYPSGTFTKGLVKGSRSWIAARQKELGGVAGGMTVSRMPEPVPTKKGYEAPTKGMVAVSPTYATQHPEAVTKIGDYYYRPAVSARQYKKAEDKGLKSHEIYAKKLIEVQKKRKAVAPIPKVEVVTAKGQEVTGIAPNVGWVTAKDEFGRTVTVYDPRAYATLKGHTPGYFGMPGYLKTTGRDVPIPEDFEKLLPLAQFEWMKDYGGRIPKKAEFIKGKKLGEWSYRTPEQAIKVQAYKEAVKVLHPFKTLPTPEQFAKGKIPKTYDLVAALEKGVSVKTLSILFDAESIKQAEATLAKADISVSEEIQRASLSWFDKVKGFFGLTPEGIKEAKVTYLTTPPMPEATGVKERSAREMLSILVPTISKQTVEPKNVSIKEAFKAMVEMEKAKISLGTAGMALTVAYKAPPVRAEVKEFAEPLPVGIEQVVKFGGALFLGAMSAPIYSAIVTGHLVKAAWAPDKVKSLADLGKGIATFFISIPATVVAEPALAIGEFTGLFIVGPEGAARIVKSIGARGVPSYIPTRGMGIEYSVVRVPVKIASKQAVVRAVNEGIARAMKNKSGTAIVKVGDGKIRLKIRSTPVSEVVGPALYHATPALTKALKRGQVTGTLYTTPHLAVRFAESSAKGVPSSNPAILMIYTRKGKVEWSPTTNLYKGAKEMEAVYGVTKLEPVKSLWNRLTFGKAGDFITVHRGQIIPIWRFKEPGAVAPRINLADLVAIRIKTVQASLVDLVKGKKGIEITKESREAITKRVIKEAEKEIKKGKNTTDAYDAVFHSEIRRLVERNRPQLERLYRANPEVFERAYREHLEGEYRSIIRERPPIRRVTREESRQIERGRIPERLRRLDERERPRERVIAELGIPRIPRRPPERPPRVPPRKPPPIKPPRIPPPRVPPPIKPPKMPPPVIMTTVAGVKRARIPVGSITWRQGMVWKYIPPPWTQEKPLTLWQPPIGALKTGERTPAQTIQMIGKPRAKVPQSASVDLGIADIYISKSGRAIRFEGKGLETIVGHSISESTTGMSIPAVAPMSAISKIRGTSEEALKKLAFGTEIKSLLIENYREDIPKKFADKVLATKLGEMKPEDIAKEIQATRMTATRQAEVLRMLPDRERAQIKRLLEEKVIGYAPVRGVPKPVWTTSKLRRKKLKTGKAKKIIPSITTARMT